MTSQQRQLVRHSFDAVRDLSGPVALLFYGRLFEIELKHGCRGRLNRCHRVAGKG